MTNRPPAPPRIWTVGLLFPPWGLARLWLDRERSVLRKFAGSLVLALYSLVYGAGLIALILALGWLELEWRGGFPPVLTLRKTTPDYAAVEAHRSHDPSGPTTNAQPAATPSQPAPYWTGFRGPLRDGRYTQAPILTHWPAGGPRRLWKQPIGGGYASFAVAYGRAFTLEQRRDHEAVTAYDVESGHELWAHAYPAFFNESMGGEGPRSTPTWDDGRVYALGATGEFHCLDAVTGRVLWRTNILTANQAANLTWAQSASPWVAGDRVIVAPGGPSGRSVVAYHKLTGERLWSALDQPAAYSSPFAATLGGRRQLLVAVLDRIVGLDEQTGGLLWGFPWVVRMNNRNIAQPVVIGTNRLFLSAGYGTGSAAVELQPSGGELRPRQVWFNQNLKNKFTSSVFHEGFVYGLDEDILACIEAETGQRRWKEGRYGYGQLILAEGHLVILGGTGELALVRATPDRHDELARFQAIEGKTWNHPALADGRLLVRNAVQMACFDLRPGR